MTGFMDDWNLENLDFPATKEPVKPNINRISFNIPTIH